MANNQIVISRIQNRRGRRENLPQPLLPGEIAITSDTEQMWVGQDPDLASASIKVYADKSETTAQTIVDNYILEAKYDSTFALADFQTLVTELKASGSVTLTDDDILYDSTTRGAILSFTFTPGTGSGYTGGGVGVGDAITVTSSTGSGFVGAVDTVDGGNGILTVEITNPGQNYKAGDTVAIANGTGHDFTLTASNIHSQTVHIAARPNVDPNNTIANISTALGLATADAKAITVAGAYAPVTSEYQAYGGTFSASARSANNHTEVANVVSLINKVNSESPSQITGLVYSGLNLEVTAPPTETSMQVAGSDLVTAITTGTSVAYFRAPSTITLSEVRASLLTASTSGAVTIDINVNGSSILSTLLTIDQDEKTSLTAATPAVISNYIINSDDEVTVDIDGAGTGALGLIITFLGVS